MAITSVKELLLLGIRLRLLLSLEERIACRIVYAIPNIVAIVGELVYRKLIGEILLQKPINLTRYTLQGLEVGIANRCSPILEHSSHALILISMRLLLLLDTAHAQHVGVRQKEMIHLVDRAVYSVAEELNLVWSLLPPLVYLCRRATTVEDAINVLLAVHLKPSTNNGITQNQTVGKERSLHVLMDNIKP